MKWGVHRARNSQKIADRLQSRADKLDAKAERNSGKLGNGMTIRAAKQAGKNAARQQKYATKLEQKTAAKLEKKSSKEEDKARKEATKQAHEAWKKEASGTEMANKVFQKAAKDFEKTAEIINNDPNYKGKDVTKGLLARQYQATMNHYFNEQLAQSSVDLTLNDQGRAYIYQFDARTGYMKGVEHRMVLHAAMTDGFALPDYKVELNDLGHMVGFTPATELQHYGIPGMKWGIRKSNASGGSKSGGKSAPKGPPPKAPANEAASQKYNRLRTQIKTHGPNSLEPDELNFVNARTEAIAKVNKMNLSSPGWLTDTSKVVLQDTTKTLMKDLAKAAVKEYIAKPLIKSAIKGS